MAQATDDARPHHEPWEELPGFLPSAVWRVGHRSTELSPTFIQRYVGPHISANPTWHERWELVLVFRGKGLFHCDGEPHPFNPAYAYLVAPGSPHREEAARSMDTLWIGVSGTLMEALPKNLIRIATTKELHSTARQLWLCSQHRASADGVELDGLTRCLIGQILHQRADQACAGREFLDSSVEYLHRHAARALSVTALAARFGYSERHFSRAFKQHTGLSPQRYVTRVRIDNAIKLMAQRRFSIAEIARLIGYPDPAYFSRVFRQHTGRTLSSLVP